MKACKHCGNEFPVDSMKPTKVYCRERCMRNAHNTRRRPRSSTRRVAEKRRQIGAIRRNKEYIYQDKMARGCNRCTERRPSTLDYHHLDRTTKEFTISRLRAVSFERLIKEIKKCVLLCSNCHRVEEQGDGYRDSDIDALRALINPPPGD